MFYAQGISTQRIIVFCMLYALIPLAYATNHGAPMLHYPAFSQCKNYASMPNISASSAMIIDVLNNQIIAKRNEHQVRSIASLSKLMTALVTLEALSRGQFSLAKRYKVFKDAVDSLPFDASRVGFVIGDIPTGLQLLQGLLIRSGNDAALTIAQHVGGTVMNFVNMMNTQALRLGLKDTAFVEPTGLSPDNKSTALDIARLALYLLRYKLFDITSITKKRFMVWKGASYRSTNLLLEDDGIVDGLKTGYTEEAEFNFVTTAVHKKRRLLAIVLGVSAPNIQEGVIKRTEEARQMLNYGFNEFSLIEFRYKTQLPIWGGKIDMLSVHVREQTYAIPSQWVSKISSRVFHDDLWAPVQRGSPVGNIKYEYENESGVCSIADLKLISDETVKSKFIQFFDKIRYFFYKRKK